MIRRDFIAFLGAAAAWPLAVRAQQGKVAHIGVPARLPNLATELVTSQVDVVVATFTPCALAAKRATTTIPIVMAAVADPSASDS